MKPYKGFNHNILQKDKHACPRCRVILRPKYKCPFCSKGTDVVISVPISELGEPTTELGEPTTELGGKDVNGENPGLYTNKVE